MLTTLCWICKKSVVLLVRAGVELLVDCGHDTHIGGRCCALVYVPYALKDRVGNERGRENRNFS